MSHITLNDRIGDIVVMFPQASGIFQKYGIDFCCGGQRPLSAAMEETSVGAEKLLSELNSGYSKMVEERDVPRDFRTMPLDDLVDHIVNTHHTFLGQALPELGQLTTTVLRAHGTNHRELSQVHKLTHTLKMELEQHLITEEEVLFPLIKQYASSGSKEHLERSVTTIEQLEDEHDVAGDALKQLRQITSQYNLPADACGTYQRLYELLQQLEGDVFQHIHLENNILHPRLMAKLKG